MIRLSAARATSRFGKLLGRFSFQKADERCLFLPKWAGTHSLTLRAFFQNIFHHAAHVVFQHRRMHITLAADGRSIPELFGDRLDGLHNIFLRLRLGLECIAFLQRDACQNCSGPGTKIFSGKLLAADFAEIVIDIRRVDGMGLPIVADILEQFIAGQVLASPDNFG